MDQHRFDALLMRLTKEPRSRRLALRLVVSTVLAGALAGGGARLAAAACKQNGRPCDGGNQCCSGVCRGKRGRKKCRPAPGQGSCTIAKDTCKVGGVVGACASGGGEGCACLRRPSGAAFCADLTTIDCLPCAQCPTGTTCVRAPFNSCSTCGHGTLCVRRCGALPE